MTKGCQLITKLPRFLYGTFDLCPNDAKHSIIRRVKRHNRYTGESRKVRICDEHLYKAKEAKEFMGDIQSEFSENQL